jgi:hypothetical protein
MLNRSALLLAAGAAIIALDASAASAQDTTRVRRPTSTQRIRVGKEAPGEVTVRVDTVTMYRTDTLTLPPRVDTVVRTNTVTRTVHDTVTQMIPIKVPQISGFYAGIAAGGSMPGAQFNDSDHPGWRIEVPVGFDFTGSPLGVRVLGGYANFSPHSWVGGILDNAQVWNLDGNLKLRIASATPAMLRLQFYGTGGVSYNWFKEILENDRGLLSVGDSTQRVTRPVPVDNSWHSGWGYNIGGGLEVGKGHTNVYVESRWVRWNGVNTNLSNVPLVIGVNFY